MRKQTAWRTGQMLLTVLLLVTGLSAFAQRDTLPNALTFSYDHTHFDKQFANDWQVASLEYRYRTGFGAVLGRVNYANRFARNGWQGEVEAYPVISKKLYAYTGVSYAADVPLFPRWRTGATLYYNLPKGWEAEGGFRYLFFSENIWMATAGMSKYLGAWLLNVRSFFSLHTPVQNQSFFIKAQRYLPNENDYVWLQLGSGVSPDESRSVQLNTTARLFSRRVAAGARLSLNPQVQALLTAGFARDEYRTKTYGNQYNGSAGLSFRF